MKIKEISLGGFRAFNQVYQFSFDDKLTLIIGENGTGKTSLFDGIQFSLLGKLLQYEDIEEAKTEDMIINRNNPKGELKVRILLESDKGETIEIERSASKGKKILLPTRAVRYEVLQGEELENKIEQITFDTFQSTVYLRQELIREFIHADPKKERRKVVSELLGIRFKEAILQGLDEAGELLRKQYEKTSDSLSTFMSERDRVKEWKDNMEARKKELRSKFKLTEKEFELPFLVSLAKSLRGELEGVMKTVNFLEDLPEIKEDFEGLDSFTSKLDDIQTKISLDISGQVDENYGLYKELDEINQAMRNYEDEEKLKKELEKYKIQIEGEKSKLEKLDRSERLMVIAKEYLEATTPESCPVCESKIDPKEIVRKLSKRKSKETDIIVSIQGSVDKLRSAISDLEAKLETLKKLRRRKQEIESTFDYGKYMKASDMKKTLETQALEIQKLSGILSWKRDEASVPVEAPSETDVSKTKEKMLRLKHLVETVETLNLAFGSAFPKIIDKKLRDLDPIVSAYTGILTPHPTYSQILIERDGEGNYWLKGVSMAGKTHVRTLFSTAQLNEVAIVLLLAMAEISPYDLKFLILDDPSQSMDSEGKHKLSKLIEAVSHKRQLIVGTMDLEFADSLRKLCPKAKVYRFIGYANEKGPLVKS